MCHCQSRLKLLNRLQLIGLPSDDFIHDLGKFNFCCAPDKLRCQSLCGLGDFTTMSYKTLPLGSALTKTIELCGKRRDPEVCPIIESLAE